jgi:hypothetical protein
MFGFVLLGLAVVGGILGWVIGSLKRRRWWLAAVCIPLPFWLYLPVAIPVVISEGVKALGWWLIGLAMLGFPIMAWIIGAGIGFAVARFGNEARSA